VEATTRLACPVRRGRACLQQLKNHGVALTRERGVWLPQVTVMVEGSAGVQLRLLGTGCRCVMMALRRLLFFRLL
jgi:hypothetical protein